MLTRIMFYNSSNGGVMLTIKAVRNIGGGYKAKSISPNPFVYKDKEYKIKNFFTNRGNGSTVRYSTYLYLNNDISNINKIIISVDSIKYTLKKSGAYFYTISDKSIFLDDKIYTIKILSIE